MFTNYVYKRRGVGGQKNQLFIKYHTIENVNGERSKKDKSGGFDVYYLSKSADLSKP